MRKLAVLSMHTSPLAQPGTGDGGGMNVYVRQLSSALARAGVACDVYTRASSPHEPDSVDVEPGLVVHHVPAGPRRPLDKSSLHLVVDEFALAVERRMAEVEMFGEPAVDAIHANYWLSGVAGHVLKHRLGLPLVSTFHTLDRVKAEAGPEEADPSGAGRRARAESDVIGCSDAVLASCSVEVDQLVELYGADQSRVEIIAPGVDHAFFSPGDKTQARRALRLASDGPLLLFVGRIQPLKGAEVAVGCLAELDRLGVSGSTLVVVGGPSGPLGDAEVASLSRLVEARGLSARVRFVPPQTHELLSTYYRAADCCVVPSRSESFGLVALEAGACGVPVVASAVGGLTTLVEDGRTGHLVERGDARRFAERVASIWSRPDHARAMGAAAAERAKGYTWSVAAARLRRLYGELTARSLVECG
ncbi:MAG TPA: glycosyltransferase [Acidimicrobiales bacterium]|nr:glycosyltransferase [Acidimicrobiales bacterium]